MSDGAFEHAVLGMCGNDYEAPHTITTALERELGRSVTQSEVRAALLSLASKGLVQAYAFDTSIADYVPISSAAAIHEKGAWFLMSAEGRRSYEREAS